VSARRPTAQLGRIPGRNPHQGDATADRELGFHVSDATTHPALAVSTPAMAAFHRQESRSEKCWALRAAEEAKSVRPLYASYDIERLLQRQFVYVFTHV
jgi:hypothetical protein